MPCRSSCSNTLERNEVHTVREIRARTPPTPLTIDAWNWAGKTVQQGLIPQISKALFFVRLLNNPQAVRKNYGL